MLRWLCSGWTLRSDPRQCGGRSPFRCHPQLASTISYPQLNLTNRTTRAAARRFFLLQIARGPVRELSCFLFVSPESCSACGTPGLYLFAVLVQFSMLSLSLSLLHACKPSHHIESAYPVSSSTDRAPVCPFLHPAWTISDPASSASGFQRC